MKRKLEDLKVAIVCDSLDQYGGAEKIVEAMHEVFPSAPIYTSFYDRERMQKHGFSDKDKTIITPSFGGRKWLLRFAKQLFFVYPVIFERFNLRQYDIVLSSSSRFAHGVITTTDTIHICYMHSPARYAWDYFQYKDGLALHFPLNFLYPVFVSYLRVWDRAAADRVDAYIANSAYTRSRIMKFYRKDSLVINPFIDVQKFKQLENAERQPYFLYLGRFIKWRKLEMLISYFNKSGYSLRLVGNGDPSYVKKLRSKAKANIEIYERQTDDQVRQHLAGSRVLLWPSIEDFGIAPLEAQAAGKPVIAYRKGGTVDVLEENVTGVFFDEQTEASLGDAVERFLAMKFSPEKCRENAQKFRKEKFMSDLRSYILELTNESSDRP